MTEAKIVEWLKAEGEWVEKNSPLFIIENEKSTVEIEAPTNGYLRILTPINTTVPVLAVVGLLSGADAVSEHHAGRLLPGGLLPAQQMDGPRDAAPYLTLASPTLRSLATSPASVIVRASPKARLLARKLAVPLDGLNGSGLRGMIVAEDVQRAAARPTVKASPVAQRMAAQAGLDVMTIPGSGLQGRVMRQDVERAIHTARSAQPQLNEKPLPIPTDQSGMFSTPEQAPLPRCSVPKLSGLRAIIADRLSKSWHERPQVTLTTEADATNLVAARQQLNEELAPAGEKISYNALLIKLTAQALHEQPNINVQLTEDGLQTMPIHIGLAVDSERGLLVPVVRGALHKSLRQVNQEINLLAERALKGRSLPDDLTGGSFTITNLGVYEIDAFTPIINPPESAILGVGRIVSKPVGLNGQIVLREMISLSLSFDHRLIDGAPAARFLQRVKQLVERPFTLAL